MNCHSADCKHLEKPKRTESQNNSLWRYFTLLAVELNAARLSVQEVLKHYKMEIDWDKDSIHDIIWISLQKAKLGTDSTRKLKKGEIDGIYEHINRFVGQMGVHVEFPNDPDKDKERQYISNKDEVNYSKEEWKESLI